MFFNVYKVRYVNSVISAKPFYEASYYRYEVYEKSFPKHWIYSRHLVRERAKGAKASF